MRLLVQPLEHKNLDVLDDLMKSNVDPEFVYKPYDALILVVVHYLVQALQLHLLLDLLHLKFGAFEIAQQLLLLEYLHSLVHLSF